MNFDAILQGIDTAGTIGLLVAILVSGYFGWWVWGRQLTAAEKDRDYWRGIALELSGLTGKGIEVAHQAAEIATVRRGTNTEEETQRIVETVLDVIGRGARERDQ